MPTPTPTIFSSADDSQLLTRYLDEHSQAAFTELVRRHLNLVYATALRQLAGDHALTAEVAQAVFVDLARKANTLRAHPVLVGWLYRSTRFAAAQAVRTEQRRRTHEQTAYHLNELDTMADANWAQLRPTIDEALDDLSDGEREAILLRYFSGHSFSEVGQQLSMSPDAARKRVERAIEKLRSLLSRRGVTSTATALAMTLAGHAAVVAPVALGAKIAQGVFAAVGTQASVSVGLTKAALPLAKIIAGATAGILAVGIVLTQIKDHPAATPRPGPPPAAQSIAPNPVTSPPPIQSTPDHSSVKSAHPKSAETSKSKTNNSSIEAALKKLDELVHLTVEQKAAAREIFTAQFESLQPFTSIEELLEKGAPIHVQTRADIRTLLNPSQQTIYDRSPQRLGGASMQDPLGKLDRIDRAVTLTEEQIERTATIAQTEANALQLLSADDRLGAPGAAIRQTAKAQLRAMLTPEQQKQYAANPLGLDDLAEKKQFRNIIRSSPAIKTRFGDINKITLTKTSVTSTHLNERTQSMKGTYLFNVQGSIKDETLKVSWEKKSPTAPLKVIRIEANTGEEIQP